MYFNKPINEITFDDVVHFLSQGIPENKQLDYKYFLPEKKEKLAKTISSFANALGGMIIVGVKDSKDDTPAPPFTGIPYHEKIRGTVEDIIQVYIDPVVFVEINVVRRHEHMLIVINIPQSNLTPHTVGKARKVFVRTGQSSRPESIVHPARLPWLLDNRRKSTSLRHILLDKAASHFNNHLKTLGQRADSVKGIFSLTLVPMYPQEALTDYRDLKAVMGDISSQTVLHTVQDGIAQVYPLPHPGVFEINSYGLISYKTVLNSELVPNGGTVDFTLVARALKMFITKAVKFHAKLLFGGPLNFRMSFANTRGMKALYKTQNSPVLEDFVRIDREYNISQIESAQDAIIKELLSQASWALGLALSEEELNNI